MTYAVRPYKDGWAVYNEDNRPVFLPGAGTPEAEARALCEAHLIEREAGERTVPVELADGRLVAVVANVAARFCGLDAMGNQVVAMDVGSDWLYALTPCCHASGKGSGDGLTVCRACYVEVDDYFGGPAQVAVPVKGA